MKRTTTVVALGIVLVFPELTAQQAKPVPAPAPQSESPALAAGWSALAAGDVAKASAAANAAVSSQPRSIAAAALLIEVEIARGGGLAGLQAYEGWLGARKLEDGYLLRRVARAILWDGSNSPDVGVLALEFLAGDDDIAARARLSIGTGQGSLAETRALARIGDEGAVNRLILALEKQTGTARLRYIDWLAESGHRRAIPVLMRFLDDQDPLIVLHAANALGKLDAKGALPRLRQIHADASASGFFPVQLASAGSLFQLGDFSAVGFLQRQLTSEAATVRIQAAEYMVNRPDGTWQQVVRALVADSDPAIRIRAARLIAPFDLDLARQTLEAAAVDGNPAVRNLAGKAVAERTATDFGVFRRLIRSPDPEVRTRAAGRVLELTR